MPCNVSLHIGHTMHNLKENYKMVSCFCSKNKCSSGSIKSLPAPHAMRLHWVPGHAGVKGNEIADRLARSGSGQQLIGPQPFLGVSTQNIRKRMKCWLKNCGEVPVVRRGRLGN